MRAGRPLALALLLVASWGAQAQADGPVEAAVKFHEAMQSGRCKEVWALSSKGRKVHIRGDSRRKALEAGYLPDEEPPELSCWRIGKLKPGTAKLELQVGGEAVVSAMFRGAAPRHAYDFMARFVEYTEELDLVREGGAWKVEWPREKVQSSQAVINVGVGPVDFRMDPVVRQLHHKLEATVPARVPRDTLEAVLLDPKAWANLLPAIKSMEPLGGTGNARLARLSFLDASKPIPVVVKVSGRPVDPKADSTSIEWEVEHGVEAPVYIRGAWTLKPNPDGTTQVGLVLVLNPRHWPDYRRRFWADGMAKSVTRLVETAGNPKLVREDGTWKVDPPKPPPRPPGARNVEIGNIDVYQGEMVWGLLQKMEAVGIVRAPREALDGVLRDPEAWARVLPSFQSIEALERTGEMDRARISFAAPERAVTVTFRRHGKVAGDASATSSQLRWDPEGGNNAKVYLRGGWKLDSVARGTRVTLDLHIDPRHWPPDASDEMFSAERLAQAILDLEKAAPRAP